MNKIRITGGNLKGKTIDVAEGKDARYTSSMVREALFNIIGNLEGKNVLDLFAGAGSFSIEALSRRRGFGNICGERPRKGESPPQ